MQRLIPMLNRQRLMAALLGLGLCLVPMAAPAAENLVFVSGAFRRSIAVSDLEHLALTGEARGLLSDVLRLARQEPAEMAKLLNTSVKLPVVLVSRLLNTRIGEAILDRLAGIVFPLNSRDSGLPALRSAIVLGISPGNGSLTPISFLRAYPNQELGVNLPALMALASKASSIADLVRFFSESPLDGLRGDAPEKGSSTDKPRQDKPATDPSSPQAPTPQAPASARPAPEKPAAAAP